MQESVAASRTPVPYGTVCTWLGVGPDQCIHVGNGDSGELTRATAAGMTAHPLLTDDASTALIYDAEPAWSVPTIRRLAETKRIVSEESGDRK